ncbi:MAG TPA: hypothetical protein VM074_08890 [Solimonas sp.]|nr:hypothetical protein [Solimonas sp.]
MQSPSFTCARLAGLIGAAALALAACSNGDNDTPPATGAARVANGITDSDANGLDSRIIEAFQFNGIAFGSGSGIKNPPIGSYTAHLDINAQPFTVDHVDVSHNDLTTIFTYGTVAGGTFDGFVAQESLTAPASTQFVVQPLHSALQVSLTTPTLRYHFVAPGSGAIGASTPIAAPFATQTALQTLPVGNYEIIVTNGATVLYDSGPGAGVTLPPSGSNVLQLAALDAPGSPNGSTLSLLLLDNTGGTTLLLNGAH